MPVPEQILINATADRLTDAAQLLMDAARAANAESPVFQAGREYIAEPIGLAVQAIFMADVWDQPGRKVELDAEKTRQRMRGLGYGIGCALGALPIAARGLLIAEVLLGVSRGEEQRRLAQRELDR